MSLPAVDLSVANTSRQTSSTSPQNGDQATGAFASLLHGPAQDNPPSKPLAAPVQSASNNNAAIPPRTSKTTSDAGNQGSVSAAPPGSASSGSALSGKSDTSSTKADKNGGAADTADTSVNTVISAQLLNVVQPVPPSVVVVPTQGGASDPASLTPDQLNTKSDRTVDVLAPPAASGVLGTDASTTSASKLDPTSSTAQVEIAALPGIQHTGATLPPTPSALSNQTPVSPSTAPLTSSASALVSQLAAATKTSPSSQSGEKPSSIAAGLANPAPTTTAETTIGLPIPIHPVAVPDSQVRNQSPLDPGTSAANDSTSNTQTNPIVDGPPPPTPIVADTGPTLAVATSALAGAEADSPDAATGHKLGGALSAQSGETVGAAGTSGTTGSTLPFAPALATTASGATSDSSQSTSNAQNTSGGPNQPIPVPAQQLALAITRASVSGTQSFTLQLKPERLGSVDVKLEVDAKGRATATFVAERPETLALLRQDAHHLLKSLSEAGVNTDAGSLSFSLRNSNNTFAEAQDQRGGFNQGSRRGIGTQAGAELDPPAAVYRSTGTSRLYDIQA
jgi:flagellar hook-length control protein FliK